MTDPVRFTTTIAEARKNATGIVVPPDAIETLGAGKKPAVVVTVGDYEYRSTVGVMGGQYLIPLSAAHRAASGLAGGQEVEVTLAVDTAPRTVEVPAELERAFVGEPAARASFDALSPSRQKALVLSITEAKTDDTRARRLEKALEELR